MKAIAAVDKNWGIGKDGNLLIHLPGDLKFFKEKTLGNIVIMGRATLESLPGGKPLPGRTTVVMTRRKDLTGDFYTADSVDDLMALLKELAVKKPDAVPYIAGGERIYEQLLPFADGCIITKIDRAFDAEKFFPDLDANPDFKLINRGEPNEENGVSYRFCEYERIEK